MWTIAFASTAISQSVNQSPNGYDETASGLRLNLHHAVQSAQNVDVEIRNRGVELYRQNKLVEASRVLQQAVKKNKADAEAWYYLGLALTQEGSKFKEAAKAFETATRLRPNFAAAHTGLAQALLLRNKLSDANREAQAALSIDPSIAYAHYIVGLVLLRAGKSDEALAKAKEINSRFPNFAHAYLLKAQTLVNQHARITIEATRVIQHSPVPQTPERRAGRRQRRLQSAALLKEAAQSLETYLKLNPGDSSSELWREQASTLNFYGGYTGDKNSDEIPLSSDDVTTKARALVKPEPSYTEGARRAQVTGTVVLWAVLSADGTVRDILVLAGLPYGLTEAAIRAARKIKFVPATVDGRRVSTFIQLEYSFNLY